MGQPRYKPLFGGKIREKRFLVPEGSSETSNCKPKVAFKQFRSFQYPSKHWGILKKNQRYEEDLSLCFRKV